MSDQKLPCEVRVYVPALAKGADTSTAVSIKYKC
jgi:hypothetical protein